MEATFTVLSPDTENREAQREQPWYGCLPHQAVVELIGGGSIDCVYVCV